MQDLDELFHQMEKAADRLFDRAWLQHLTHVYWEPHMNAYECGEAFVFLVELPGLLIDQISIHLAGDVLIISGIKQDPRPEGATRCLHMEVPQGRFRKQIRIGEPIKANEIKATLKNGVLRIVVPKETSW